MSDIAEIWENVKYQNCGNLEKNCGNLGKNYGNLGKNCGNLGKKSNIISAEIWENNAEIWQLQDLLAEIWKLIDCGNLATSCGNMNATQCGLFQKSYPNPQCLDIPFLGVFFTFRISGVTSWQ
jgi:hypothetical protein